MSRLRLAALAASAVLLVPGVAEAGTTNQPYANGNNATGYGYGFSSTDFHDIDRKVCGLFGCNYDDGTNVFYGSGGTGYVSLTVSSANPRTDSRDSSRCSSTLMLPAYSGTIAPLAHEPPC